VTSSTVGAVGFCMGGGFVLLLAAQQDGASAPRSRTTASARRSRDLRGLTAAVQGHYGERDDFYPAATPGRRPTRSAGSPAPRWSSTSTTPATRSTTTTNALGTYSEADATLAWSRTGSSCGSTVV
jgi:carboxymethylenebutenolidase